VWERERLHLCMCVRQHLCMCVRLRLYMCVRLRLCMCVRLCLCMCVRLNLGIHDFSSWDHLGFQKLVWSRQNLKIQNLNHSNFVKWEVDQNNKCRSWWAWQTWYWWLLYLKPFSVSKTRVKVLFFKIKSLTWSNLIKWDTKWPQMKNF
jgi:hypothetical protein